MDLEHEKELVFKAKTDADAFGLLYDEYYKKIFGYVLRRTANVEVTKDITSEVFLKALQNIGHFQWRDIPFSAWLFRIAGNIINDRYNDNRQSISLKHKIADSEIIFNVSFNEEIIQAEADIQKQQDFLALHNCIIKLPHNYQEVIVLKYFEKKQIKEIGEILGKREGTVKSLLHRSLKRLKKLMEKSATF